MEENVFLSYISVGTLTHEFPDKTDIFLPTCSSEMLSPGVFRTHFFAKMVKGTLTQI